MEIGTLAGLTHVVFHHSAGPRSQTFEDLERFHVTPKQQGGRGYLAIAYHVVILPDGKVRYGRRLPQEGAHAMGWNDRSIGVCLVGDNTKPDQGWTTEQIVAARKYLAALELVIPGLIVVGHQDTGRATECPGIEHAKLLKMLGR